MHVNFRAWWSIEGFWFWQALVLLAFIYTAPVIHMEWLLQPENGFGRLSAHPAVAFLHGSLSLCILLLMLCKGTIAILLLRILGWVAVVAGFHTLWWLGPVATVFPLVWGGGKVGLASYE
jgi:hypothetical protein